MAVAAPPARRVEAGGPLKDAALAALVALVLAIPLVGLQTVEINTALTIRTRFAWVAVGVAAVFAGRLLLRLAWQARLAPLAAVGGSLIAPLRRALLGGLKLDGSVLPFSQFEDARIAGASARGADLRGSTFSGVKMQRFDLSEGNAEGADFTDAVLSKGNFAKTVLKGSDLLRADLSGADLTGADLSGTRLLAAILKDAKTEDAKFDGALMPDGNWHN